MATALAILNDRLPSMPAERWRVDKSISLPTLFAIVMGLVANAAGVSWWASGISAHVDTLEHRVTIGEQTQERLVGIVSDLRVSIAAINGALDIRPRGGNGTSSP